MLEQRELDRGLRVEAPGDPRVDEERADERREHEATRRRHVVHVPEAEAVVHEM